MSGLRVLHRHSLGSSIKSISPYPNPSILPPSYGALITTELNVVSVKITPTEQGRKSETANAVDIEELGRWEFQNTGDEGGDEGLKSVYTKGGCLSLSLQGTLSLPPLQGKDGTATNVDLGDGRKGLSIEASEVSGLFVVTAEDCTFVIGEIKDGEWNTLKEGKAGGLGVAAAFDSEGTRFVIGRKDGVCEVWDVGGGGLRKAYEVAGEEGGGWGGTNIRRQVNLAITTHRLPALIALSLGA